MAHQFDLAKIPQIRPLDLVETIRCQKTKLGQERKYYGRT